MISAVELSNISLEFPFIDSWLFLSGDLKEFEPGSNLLIDKFKVQKLLSPKPQLPLWFDYSKIAAPNPESSLQLDLLGHNDEPVLLMDDSLSGYFYLFKLKKYEPGEGIFYGKDQKLLIEKMLNLWLLNIIKAKNALQNDTVNYLQICKNQMVKIDWLNDELTKKNLEVEKFYTSLFCYFLREIITPKITLSLSDSTLYYLQSANLEFSEIETMAIESYKIALELFPHSTDIRIKKYFLPLPAETLESKQSPNKLPKNDLSDDLPEILKPEAVEKPTILAPTVVNTKPADAKLDKTILLLDRYELAVKKLIESKLPVMGKNIANVCLPKISAPALTDSINKHKERIAECFKLFPDNWPLLKSNYQPVQKLSYLI